MAILSLFCSCNDEIEVKQIYSFSISHLPVQKRIAVGETAEMRFQIHRDGHFEETRYFVRYFQPDGKGILKLENGTVLVPNDLYPLGSEIFRMYYTSLSTDQQAIDIYFEDSHGQLAQLSFSFTHESTQKEEMEE